MFLTAKHVISAITEIVNAGSAEIIDIIEKYEEELRLAKEEIDRQRQLLAAAVPQQTILKSDIPRCEIQHSDSVHFSECKKEILPVQLHRDEEEESDSSDSQFTVYPVSIASLRFEELTECQQTSKEDNLCSCHEEESGGPGEAHSFPQIDVDQMREDEKPKSSPRQAAAKMMMDNPEIQLEEEHNEELFSSSNIDKCSQNTQADSEDHTMSSTSSPSFMNLSIPLHRIQLMENSTADCRPSSPAQQMKETSQDSRDDQGGQQSNQNKMMDDPEIQQEEEEMSSSSAIDDTCSHNTQADPEDHTMSSTSSPGFKNLSIPLHRIQLIKKSGGDCRPSSPAQQMKEITQEAFNATEGRPLCSLRSNLNQYNCLVCGKVFKYCVGMKSHMKRKHTEEEKPHQNQCNCHVCEKGSKHRRSMDCTWIDQMREDEEPKSSPGQAAANMDNPEIQQEEKELSSSSAIDDTSSQNTQVDPEDCPSLRNLSMPLNGIQLMENSSGDCRPSSPAQQMKETREALNATEGCQLLSPHLLVAPSQDGRDNQGGQQSNQNQYNCLVCGKVFKRRVRMISHMTSKHKKPHQNQCNCHVCEKGFVHRSSMERHMRSKHTEEMPHQNQCNCHVCQKGPKHRRSMNRQMDCTWIDQMREDEEPKSSPGQAAANMMDNPEIQQEEMSSSSAIDDTCSQNTQADPENHTMGSTSSPSFKNLSIPLHRIQLKEKSGGDCRPSSPAQQMKEITQEALNATEGSPLRSPHLLVAPSQDSRDNQGGQQPNQNHYYCQFCGKGFKYHRNMKRHVKSNHKGEKQLNQFYCGFCGKRFEYRQNVKRHVKSHHTGLKKFCCKVCGKVFKCLSALRRHMRGNRTHT